MQPQNESIWADGVPQNVKEEDKLTIENLLALAVDHVARKYLIPNGFKIDQAQSKLGALPNIIMEKDGVLYAVCVVPSVYPNFMAINDNIRLKFYDVCQQNKAMPLFAAVGFKSTDNERANAGLALKGDAFHILFNGFVKITNEEKQDFLVKPEELFRP